jgi:hypothetical protein
MGANQNSSQELVLYPEIDLMRSLLTRSKPLAIDKLLVLETRLGTAAETRIDAGRNMCKSDDKNRIKEQFISA